MKTIIIILVLLFVVYMTCWRENKRDKSEMVTKAGWQLIALTLTIILLIAMFRINQDSNDMVKLNRCYREYFGDDAVNEMFEELEEEYYDTIDERSQDTYFYPWGQGH